MEIDTEEGCGRHDECTMCVCKIGFGECDFDQCATVRRRDGERERWEIEDMLNADTQNALGYEQIMADGSSGGCPPKIQDGS